mmetsp:Transcript_91942/g.297420  ORF Transcript_91942/g.297420 Transcript_91942/m.297420 type:complete len:287 (+) Transcript_91942:177-1037(+)
MGPESVKASTRCGSKVLACRSVAYCMADAKGSRESLWSKSKTVRSSSGAKPLNSCFNPQLADRILQLGNTQQHLWSLSSPSLAPPPSKSCGGSCAGLGGGFWPGGGNRSRLPGRLRCCCESRRICCSCSSSSSRSLAAAAAAAAKLRSAKACKGGLMPWLVVGSDTVAGVLEVRRLARQPGEAGLKKSSFGSTSWQMLMNVFFTTNPWSPPTCTGILMGPIAGKNRGSPRTSGRLHPAISSIRPPAPTSHGWTSVRAAWPLASAEGHRGLMGANKSAKTKFLPLSD